MNKIIVLNLYIKYMLSNLCKTIVDRELNKLHIMHALVQLGEVELHSPITNDQRELLRAALLNSGLVLVDIKASKLIEIIKEEINEIVEKAAEVRKENISKYLCNKLGSNYNRISKLFKEVTSMTIEQYAIIYRIEWVKELLLYTELSISEISYKLNYSSPAHLTTQFKKITGLTPSAFRKLKKIKANPLYEV